MPILIDRRYFLRYSIGAAGMVLAAAEPAVRWALLSDPHIAADPNDTFRGFKPSANLRTTVGQVKASPFDFILVNGDLARQEGKPADYDRFGAFAAELADRAPLAVTLGNHDDRTNATAGLRKLAGAPQPVANKFVTTLASGPLQFVLLDSLFITNIPAGRLGKAQRDWLANYLGAAQPKPTIVVVHHNPDGENDNALLDADRLLAIVKPQRQVKAIIFGHTHTYRYAQADGLHLINLPAVGYNFADGEAVGWVEAALRVDGGDFKLHAIAGVVKDDGKVTSVNWR